MSQTVEIIVDQEGGSRHLIEEDAGPALDGFGDVTDIYRNSHVETPQSLSAAAVQWLAEQWLPEGEPVDEVSLHEIRCTILKPTDWYADMLPVGGPVMGPFEKRQDALDAEVAWLKQHDLPLPVRDD